MQYRTRKRWTNNAGNQAAFPLRQYEPSSLEELVKIVQTAEEIGVTVRAVGSSHSWSDVCVTPDFLIRPTKLDRVLELDTSVLRDGANVRTLLEVQSGIRLRELNEALDCRGLALANMGGYDGQTIAGAVSTSTHGSGIELGPLSDFVESLDLVAARGEVYRIERSDGISDSSKYRGRYPHRHLVQDDDWFNAVVVGMGCMGVIYSTVLRVVPSFWLKEVRSLSTWDAVKESLRAGDVFTTNRHFEVLISPYMLNGTHLCLITTRNSADPPHALPRDKRRRKVLNELLSSFPLTWHILKLIFDLAPKSTPKMLDRVLRGMVDDGYTGKSYKVFNIGAANEIAAYSSELAFPMKSGTYLKAVDRILEMAEDVRNSGELFHTAPIALRFVSGTDAFLSPQYGGQTCMVEIIMVKDSVGAMELMYRYENECYRFGGRPHWGQVNTLNSELVSRLYPLLAKWTHIYQTLNESGTFDSPFTKRVGFASRKRGDG
jgi:hypothetical protein